MRVAPGLLAAFSDVDKIECDMRVRRSWIICIPEAIRLNTSGRHEFLKAITAAVPGAVSASEPVPVRIDVGGSYLSTIPSLRMATPPA